MGPERRGEAMAGFLFVTASVAGYVPRATGRQQDPRTVASTRE